MRTLAYLSLAATLSALAMALFTYKLSTVPAAYHRTYMALFLIGLATSVGGLLSARGRGIPARPLLAFCISLLISASCVPLMVLLLLVGPTLPR